MKNNLIKCVLGLMILIGPAYGAGTSDGIPEYEENSYREIPERVYDALLSSGFFDTYDIYFEMAPYLQQGDFNGDGTLDIALQVFAKNSGKRGIMIVHTDDLSSYIIGAGRQFSGLGDDFSWNKQWRKDSQALNEEKVIQTAEALIIDAPDFSKNLIYFDGEKYQIQSLESQQVNVDLPTYGYDIPQLLLRISGLNPI